MIKRLKTHKGLTLIEVLIAMAFISLIYGFVVQVFFQGFKTITMADIEDAAVRLANNELKRLSSYENPLFIGFLEGDNPSGYMYVSKLQSGEMLPYQLVLDGTVTLNERETVLFQTVDDNDDLREASNPRAVFERTVDWSVDDAEPVLVHIWVTVKWTDPEDEFPDGEYILETMLVPGN